MGAAEHTFIYLIFTAYIWLNADRLRAMGGPGLIFAT
jgi:hypothetical protein